MMEELSKQTGAILNLFELYKGADDAARKIIVQEKMILNSLFISSALRK